MEMINQPLTGQLGNRLIDLLGSTEFHTLDIIVAFAKNSGVLRIKDSLASFRERGGKVNIYVGIDLNGTSYEALTTLLLHTDSLNILHSENNQTFHPKIYQFLGKEKSLIIVGSHNLTAGGLWTNFESSLIIPIEKSKANNMNILKEMKKYTKELKSFNKSCMEIGTQADIEKLLRNGYIFNEVSEQVRFAKDKKRGNNPATLFGNGITAPLPHINILKKEMLHSTVAEPAENINYNNMSGAEQTIWFETKLMTGGSRNILDLSKKSLIERGDPRNTPFHIGDSKFMRGGVEFFGLNPTATHKKKSITLNFEGTDYLGNEILYPEGKKANGTWRLQIKGVSECGRRITDAFKAKDDNHLLVNKIITFTKIHDDYYSFSIFPTSELGNFQEASSILARNGSTKNAKQLGLILNSHESI